MFLFLLQQPYQNSCKKQTKKLRFPNFPTCEDWDAISCLEKNYFEYLAYLWNGQNGQEQLQNIIVLDHSAAQEYPLDQISSLRTDSVVHLNIQRNLSSTTLQKSTTGKSPYLKQLTSSICSWSKGVNSKEFTAFGCKDGRAFKKESTCFVSSFWCKNQIISSIKDSLKPHSAFS